MTNPIDYWYQKYLKERLTWQDMEAIHCIAKELNQEYSIAGTVVSVEAFYTEVLRRFNEQKDGIR